jgi:hypothetical protein
MKRTIDVGKVAPLPDGIPALPQGWINGLEARILYTAAQRIARVDGESAILEVGSWVGRSSCALAYAVRDCEAVRPRFDIVDYGIAGDEEWKYRFGNSIFDHKSAAAFAEVIYFPGGTGALLKKNLVDRALNTYVTLIVLGDIVHYATTTRYDLVFCDATHGEDEIRKNVPLFKELLRDNFILICDDINTEKNLQLVEELVESEQSYLSIEVDQYSKFGIFMRGDMFREFLG